MRRRGQYVPARSIAGAGGGGIYGSVDMFSATRLPHNGPDDDSAEGGWGAGLYYGYGTADEFCS